MPMKANREYRNMTIEIQKAEADGDDRKLVRGYASTFDEPYTLIDNEELRIDEVVDSSAFETTDMSDVIMQYDHKGRVFARKSNDTLFVTTDERGLLIEADLGGTEIGRQLYEEIEGGYTNKMSFGFTVDGLERIRIKSEDGRPHILRRITSVKKLYDVSAVSVPANDATSLSVRSLLDGEIEIIQAERLEEEKLALERRRAEIKAKALSIGGKSNE